MGSFESDLRILETELGVVASIGELTDEQWRASILPIPLDEKLPRTGRCSSWPAQDLEITQTWKAAEEIEIAQLGATRNAEGTPSWPPETYACVQPAYRCRHLRRRRAPCTRTSLATHL